MYTKNGVKKKTVNLNIFIPVEILQKVKAKSSLLGISIADFVILCLETNTDDISLNLNKKLKKIEVANG